MTDTTQTKIYLRHMQEEFGHSYQPYEDVAWTGKYRIKTVDNITTIYLERYVKFLGIFPITFWAVWEEEDDIIFCEESCVEIECHV